MKRADIWHGLILAMVLGSKNFSPVSLGAQLNSFQAGTGGWQMGTLAVGNINDDTALEIVVAYRSSLAGTWALDAFNSAGQ